MNMSMFSNWSFRSKSAEDITMETYWIGPPAYMNTLTGVLTILFPVSMLAIIVIRLKEQEV